MIEIDRVSVRFDGRVALDSVSLAVSGGRTALLGANGSGKSTLARLMNGLCLPSEGTVRVDGLDTQGHGRQVRRLVGFVFQNPDNQIVFPLVEEDLAFGLKNLGIDKRQIAEMIDAVLRRYDLQDFKGHPTHFLSFGQKQLLAISGVVVMDPDYIVFDEPTTLLDLRNKRRVAEAIGDLPQTVIVISHDHDLLREFDRVLVLDNGEIAVDDRPSVALPRYLEMMR